MSLSKSSLEYSGGLDSSSSERGSGSGVAVGRFGTEVAVPSLVSPLAYPVVLEPSLAKRDSSTVPGGASGVPTLVGRLGIEAVLEVQATKTSVAIRTPARTGVVVDRLLSLAFKRPPYLLNKSVYVIPSCEIEWRIVPVQEPGHFSVEADYSPRATPVAKPIRILVYSKQCPHSLCWHWHEVSLLPSDAAIDPKQDRHGCNSIVIIQENLFDLDFVVREV